MRSSGACRRLCTRRVGPPGSLRPSSIRNRCGRRRGRGSGRRSRGRGTGRTPHSGVELEFLGVFTVWVSGGFLNVYGGLGADGSATTRALLRFPKGQSLMRRPPKVSQAFSTTTKAALKSTPCAGASPIPGVLWTSTQSTVNIQRWRFGRCCIGLHGLSHRTGDVEPVIAVPRLLPETPMTEFPRMCATSWRIVLWTSSQSLVSVDCRCNQMVLCPASPQAPKH